METSILLMLVLAFFIGMVIGAIFVAALVIWLLGRRGEHFTHISK